MATNEGYYRSESEFDSVIKEKANRTDAQDIVYTYDYDKAIELAGSGKFTLTLMSVCGLALLAMTIEMYGFSVLVPACSCEFNMDQREQSILLVVPFIGGMLMAYPWGYLADTQGRKKCLQIAMLGSFLLSITSVFSVNWIMLSICKFFSNSFCSCAQSILYAWIGESCPKKIRSSNMLIMTSIAMFYLIICYVPAYFILDKIFSYNIGLVNFTPWRLLALILSLPLGVSAICLTLCPESPKFILKMGDEKKALDILKWIARKNGRKNYAVNRVTLSEEGNIENKDLSLLESFKVQTFPLFKPPYLWRTLQLFFLIGVILSCTTSLLVWFPFVGLAFYEGISNSAENTGQGLCNVIMNHQKNNVSVYKTALSRLKFRVSVTRHEVDDYWVILLLAKIYGAMMVYSLVKLLLKAICLAFMFSRKLKPFEPEICTTVIDVKLLWISLIHGATFSAINWVISKLSNWKKTVMISILVFSTASAIGTMVITDPYNISSFILFFGTLIQSLAVGIIYTYCVELYPTSHRGMISSLVILVGRINSLIAIYLVGAYILTYCAATFYTVAALLLAACTVTCFLPADRPK